MKILIVTFALFFSYSFAWSNPEDLKPTIVIEVENLTPEIFKELALNSLEDSKIEIIEACVPAKVIYIKYSGILDESGVLEIKNFFSNPSSSGNVKLLLDHSLEDFTDKCLSARLGN